jgi:recombination protein RecT
VASQQTPAPQKTAGEVALRNVESTGMGTLQGFLEVYKGQIQMALADPKTMTAERMIRIAMSAIGRQPMLKKCTMASIAACLVQASFLGLEPDGLGEAYLIPFWNGKLQVPGSDRKGGYECQLQVGYLGLVKLARNTREFSVIDAQAVHENDEFEFEKGSETWWRHKWAKTGPRGNVIGYWAGWALKDGGKQFEYWTVEQIEAHRDRYSQGAWKTEWNAQTRRKEIVLGEDGKPILQGPWADSPDWMYKKTPLKQVLKLAPKSRQLQVGISLSEHAEAGLTQKFSVEVPLELQPPADEDSDPHGQPEDPEPKRASAVIDTTAQPMQSAASSTALQQTAAGTPAGQEPATRHTATQPPAQPQSAMGAQQEPNVIELSDRDIIEYQDRVEAAGNPRPSAAQAKAELTKRNKAAKRKPDALDFGQ